MLTLKFFLQGHVKVVRYLVKEVNQFPSDSECMRYIATITDKVRWEGGKYLRRNGVVSQLQRQCYEFSLAHWPPAFSQSMSPIGIFEEKQQEMRTRGALYSMYFVISGDAEEVPPVYGVNCSSQR